MGYNYSSHFQVVFKIYYSFENYANSSKSQEIGLRNKHLIVTSWCRLFLLGSHLNTKTNLNVIILVTLMLA